MLSDVVVCSCPDVNPIPVNMRLVLVHALEISGSKQFDDPLYSALVDSTSLGPMTSATDV